MKRNNYHLMCGCCWAGAYLLLGQGTCADIGRASIHNDSAENSVERFHSRGYIHTYIHTYIHKLYLSSDFSVAYKASISDPN